MFGNGLFELLRIFRLQSLPSFFDFRVSNSVLDGWSVGSLWLEGSTWSHHVKLVALQRLTVFRVRIGCLTKRKFYLLDILISLCRYGLNRGTEVIDHIVIGDDVSNVFALIDDLSVLFGWPDVLRIARFVPMSIADKRVSSRANAIIRIGPRGDRLIHGDVCFGW